MKQFRVYLSETAWTLDSEGSRGNKLEPALTLIYDLDHVRAFLTIWSQGSLGKGYFGLICLQFCGVGVGSRYLVGPACGYLYKHIYRYVGL